MDVLVIAPHMDDEVLGVGGTICKHVASGDQVKVLFLANRVYNHKLDLEALDREEAHARAAQEVLRYHEVEFARLPDEQLRENFVDLLTVIENSVADFQPDIVYVNHRADPHQDHKAAFEAAVISLRAVNQLPRRLERIVCYEIPSSTDQVPPFVEYAFIPNYFVEISPFLTQKQKAMACYETESRLFPHPRSPKGIASLAQMRGLASSMNAAEAFMIIREEWS